MKCNFMIFMVLFVSVAFAQSFQEQKHEFISLNDGAMKVLGSWALVNIAAGSIGGLRSGGEAKHFAFGNAGWNVVNLAIAAGYFYFNNNAAIGSPEMLLAEKSKLQNLLALNAGLDVAYMVTGMYLKERAKNSRSNAEQLRGYGNALLVQGAFLLVFDGFLYFLNN